MKPIFQYIVTETVKYKLKRKQKSKMRVGNMPLLRHFEMFPKKKFVVIGWKKSLQKILISI